MKFDPQTGSVLHIELARSNSRRKRKPGIYLFITCSFSFKQLFFHYPPNLWFYCFFRMITGLLFCTGSGAYVVIDKRSKGEPDLQGSSSEDGNVT